MSRLWLVAAAAVVLLADPWEARALEVYVAPGGWDDAAGTREAPLATLAGARDRVRELKAARAGEPIEIWFAAGVYRLPFTVTFDERDSGTAEAPMVYRAEPGAEVRIVGGIEVSDWAEVEDPAVLERLPEVARAQVRVADLAGKKASDFGHLTVYGFGTHRQPAEAELFYDDAPMRLARWPNGGFRGVVAVDGVKRVTVDTDRVARWMDEKAPWVFAYWHHDWAEIAEPLAGIDAEHSVLVRSDDVDPRYGITPERARWYGFNLLSELDEPGEYYASGRGLKLYFWPPRPGGRAVLSQWVNLIFAQRLTHVTFRGFVFEACRGTAIILEGGASCRIEDCVIRNAGQNGVEVKGGTDHAVIGCEVYQCGEGGISMQGGDRRMLVPAGHRAENNDVHDFSRRARTYHPGISVSGVGSRIAHNRIHDCPHMALSAPGNDHVIEYNEIYHAVYESGDAGAYYVGRDWTQRGNLLRYNYWHDIAGSTGYGGMTIYLDDQQCGHTIVGNVFERCSQAVFIGGGDDNLVTNNVFIDCRKAAHLDNRGMGWQKAATDDPDGTLRTRLRAMPIQNETWATHYPTLPGILDDEPNIPKRNVFARNISAGGRWDDIDRKIREYQVIKDNLVFDDDPDWVRLVMDPSGRPVRLEFKDPDRVRAIGFRDIPVERMGLDGENQGVGR